MYRQTELGYKVMFNKPEASAEILAALRRHGGNGEETAKELNISRRNLDRWVLALALTANVEQIRASTLDKREAGKKAVAAKKAARRLER